MKRRFAEDTSVPVGRTQDEIKARLRSHGADQIAVFESGEQTAVAFRIGAAMYRITVPIDPKAKNRPQDERRAWRLLGLLMKSKLEAVREGATTVEREFLSDMLMRDGATVGEVILPQLESHYKSGSPVTLMLEHRKD